MPHAQDHSDRHLPTGNDALNLTQLLAGIAGNGLSISGGVLAVNTGTGLEVSADAVRISTGAAGNGLGGGGASALEVLVDGSTIEINLDTLRVKDLGITSGKLADDAVTLAKLEDTAYLSGTWTPDLTAFTTNPTMGTGNSRAGRYIRVGKLFICWVRIVFGSAGVAAGSGRYFVSMPGGISQNSSLANNKVGQAFLYDSSGAVMAHTFVSIDFGTELFVLDYAATWPTGTITSVAHNAPWTWAANDEIQFFAVCEVD